MHRLIDILTVDYLRLHLVPYGPLIYWGAQPLGFLEEPVTATIPHVVWNRFVTIFKSRGRLLDDEDQARTLSDNVFIPLSATLVILQLFGVKPRTSQQDDGDLSVIAIEPLYGWDPSPGSPTPLLDKMSERTLSVRFNWKERDLADPRKAVDKNGTLTFLFVPKIHGGPGLLISFELGGSFNIRLNKDWRFKLTPSVTAGDLFIHFDEFSKTERGSSWPAEHQAGFRGRQRGRPPVPVREGRRLACGIRTVRNRVRIFHRGRGRQGGVAEKRTGAESRQEPATASCLKFCRARRGFRSIWVWDGRRSGDSSSMAARATSSSKRIRRPRHRLP